MPPTKPILEPSTGLSPDQAGRRGRMIEALLSSNDRPMSASMQGGAEFAEAAVGGGHQPRRGGPDAVRADATSRFNAILENFGAASLGEVLDLLGHAGLNNEQRLCLGTLVQQTFPGILGGGGGSPHVSPGTASAPPGPAMHPASGGGPGMSGPTPQRGSLGRQTTVPSDPAQLGAPGNGPGAGAERATASAASDAGLGRRLVNQAKSALVKGAPPLKVLDRLRRLGVKV